MENHQALVEAINEGVDKIVASNLTLAIVMHEQNPNKKILSWNSPQVLYHDILRTLRTGR